MASPFKQALLKHTAAAMIIPATLALAGCAPQAAAVGGKAEVKAGMSALRDKLASIDGVESAKVGGGYDGAPNRRTLSVTLYMRDLSSPVVTPTVTDALTTAWTFDAFTPISYSIEVWPAPEQPDPQDGDTMFDLTTIQPELGIGGYVLDNALVFSRDDLTAWIQ